MERDRSWAVGSCRPEKGSRVRNWTAKAKGHQHPLHRPTGKSFRFKGIPATTRVDFLGIGSQALVGKPA